MKIARRSAALIALALSLPNPFLSSVAQAADRPPYVGKYALDCGQGKQCGLEIDDPKGDSYLAIFIVAQRDDFDKWTPCTFPVVLGNLGDRLAGRFLHQSMQLTPTDHGQLILSGMPRTDKCKLDLNGIYEPVAE